jgi:hypothetical protein
MTFDSTFKHSGAAMSRPTIFTLTTAVALVAGAPATGDAQTLRPPTPSLSLAGAPVPPVALKSAYHVRLTSTWPQEGGSGACRNGGQETVEGTLSQDADGTFSGRFTRRTELLFCGAHGQPDEGAAGSCALALVGEGQVLAKGIVLADSESPSGRALRLTWTPAPGHEAGVTGACADEFKQAMRAMYLSTAHAAEFGLTPAGAGPRTERLENYAWTVELD